MIGHFDFRSQAEAPEPIRSLLDEFLAVAKDKRSLGLDSLHNITENLGFPRSGCGDQELPIKFLKTLHNGI